MLCSTIPPVFAYRMLDNNNNKKKALRGKLKTPQIPPKRSVLEAVRRKTPLWGAGPGAASGVRGDANPAGPGAGGKGGGPGAKLPGWGGRGGRGGGGFGGREEGGAHARGRPGVLARRPASEVVEKQ